MIPAFTVRLVHRNRISHLRQRFPRTPRIFSLTLTAGPCCGAALRFAGPLLASRRYESHNEMMDATFARLQDIFRAVLLDDTLTLTPETSGKDFEAWDSLTHVTLMVHAERAFGIQFTSSEISGWQNAGELAQLIEARLQKG